MKLVSRILSAAVLAGSAVFASAAPSLIVFGDSLSDSGNNTILLPGGAHIQTITGNDYVPTFTYVPSGVYSNGDVWATQFAALMGFGPLVASLTPGNDFTQTSTNFAYGGAKTSGGEVPSLLQQATTFAAGAGTTDYSNTLFVVAGGGNNARDTLGNLASAGGANLAPDAQQYAIDTKNIVDQLQSKGAEHIIVWNVPNIGITPAAGAAGASAAGAFVAGTFNAALNASLAGENVKIFDIFGLTSSVAAAPAAFGFENVSDACGAPTNSAACQNISKDLFWDGIHPTTATHSLIAGQIFALAAPVPEPSELDMMLIGLVAVVGFARRRNA